LYFVVTGEAERSSIPKTMAMETATKEAEIAMVVAEVTEGTAPELEAAVAPEVVVGAHVDALPGTSMEVIV
jgi:hypothetical protein